MEVPSTDDASPAVSYRNVKAIKVSAAPSIEDFIIIKPISPGAFGKVYLAQKIHPKNKVYAVKLGKAGGTIISSFIYKTESSALPQYYVKWSETRKSADAVIVVPKGDRIMIEKKK